MFAKPCYKHKVLSVCAFIFYSVTIFINRRMNLTLNCTEEELYLLSCVNVSMLDKTIYRHDIELKLMVIDQLYYEFV